MDKVKGTLEIDRDRGVIYFTAEPPRPQEQSRLRPIKPWLRLRICQLPMPMPAKNQTGMIDVVAGPTTYEVQ